MHLLVVSQYFWPEDFRVNDLVSGLENRGHKVTVLTGLPNYPSGLLDIDFIKNPSKYRKYNNVDIIRVPIILRGSNKIKLLLNYVSFALSASTIGVYKLRKLNFDLIFVFEPSPITVGLPAILLRKIKKVPVIFWALDLWPDTLNAIGIVKSKFILNLIGGLVSFIYNRCDLILGQSKSFLPHIQKYSNHSNIKYFPGWAESVFSDIKDENSLPHNKKSFDIIFTGNIGDAQDFPSVLNAIELLKADSNIHWTIVGNGRLLSWLENEIVIRNLIGSVTLAGRHPINKMPYFFNKADVLLVSLLDEPIFSMTIPGKLQAYLTSGKPILGMLNGEGSNIINESGCGYVSNAGDSKSLANNVSKIKKMTIEERQTMGALGLKYSKTVFDRNKSIDALEGWMIQLPNGNVEM